jgi:RNA polymerase sigma-70 factor (ECF subfamily)
LVPPNVEASPMPTDAGVLAGEDDVALMSKVAARDQTAFERLVTRHAEAMARLTRRLMGYSADAEDVVQEVFARVWERAKDFRSGARVTTWMTAIALNACRSWQRRAWVRRLATLRLRRESEVHAPPALVDLARRERDEQVRAAIRGLRAVDREVIVLHYLQEHDVPEVAELLRISRGAVEVRLHRARRRLRELLGEAFEME